MVRKKNSNSNGNTGSENTSNVRLKSTYLYNIEALNRDSLAKLNEYITRKSNNEYMTASELADYEEARKDYVSSAQKLNTMSGAKPIEYQPYESPLSATDYAGVFNRYNLPSTNRNVMRSGDVSVGLDFKDNFYKNTGLGKVGGDWIADLGTDIKNSVDYYSAFKNADEHKKFVYSNKPYSEIVSEIEKLKEANTPEAEEEIAWLTDFAENNPNVIMSMTKDEYDSMLGGYDERIDSNKKQSSAASDRYAYLTKLLTENKAKLERGHKVEGMTLSEIQAERKRLEAEAKETGNLADQLSAKKTQTERNYGVYKNWYVPETEEFNEGGYKRDYTNPTPQQLDEGYGAYEKALQDIAYPRGGSVGEDGSVYDAEGNVLYDASKYDVEDKLGLYLSTSKEDIDEALTTLAGPAGGNSTYARLLQEGVTGSWNELTDYEIKLYYYLYSSQGKDAAYQFLNDITTELNRREMEKEEKALAEMNFWGLAWENIKSVPKNVLGGAIGFADDVNRMARGEELNPYSRAHSWQNDALVSRQEMANDLDNATGNIKIPWINYGAGEAYQALMSGADSLAGAHLLGGNGYGVLMGMGAASSTAKDLYERGASNDQIMAGALLAGAAEMIFEQLSIEHLVEMKSSAGKKLIINMLKQGGVEASEEVLTELANAISDYAIMGGASKYDNPQDAAKDIVKAGLSGFISGLASSGVTGTKNNIVVNGDNRKKYGDKPVALVDEALKHDPKNEFAQKLKKKLDQGKSLTGTEVTLLVEMNTEAEMTADRAKLGDAVKDRLTALGETSNINTLSEVIVDSVVEGQTTKPFLINRSDFGAQVLDELMGRGVSTDTEWNARLGTNLVNPERYNRGYIKDLEGAAREYNKKASALPESNSYTETDNGITYKGVTKEGTDVEVKGIDIVTGEIVTDKGNYAAEDIALTDNATARLVDNATKYNRHNVADLYIAAYDPKRVSVSKYNSAFDGIYTAAKAGESFETAWDRYNVYDAFNETEAKYIWQAGNDEYTVDQNRRDAKLSGDTTVAKTPTKKAKSNGEVRFRNGVTADTTEQKNVVKLAKQIANIIGIDIEFFDSRVDKNVNGWFDRRTDTIHLDMQKAINDRHTIAYTLSHELMHYIEKWSPAKHDTFAKFLLEKYAEKGMDLNAMLVRKQLELEANNGGKRVSVDEAYSELIADSCEAFLLDSNATEVLAELAAQDRDLVARIKRFFADILNKLRKAYKGLNPQSIEGQMMRKITAECEQIHRMFEEALADAVQNYKQAETIEMDAIIEETPNLIAVHNITGNQLVNAYEKGGIAGPSVAVVKNAITKFGEISLAFDKSSIDPSVNTANKLYGSDAWTPGQTTLKKNAVFDKAKTEAAIDKVHNILGEHTELFDVTVEQIQREMTKAKGDLHAAWDNNVGLQTAYALQEGIIDAIPENNDGTVNMAQLEEELKALSSGTGVVWGKYRRSFVEPLIDNTIKSYDAATVDETVVVMREKPNTAKTFKLTSDGTLTIPAARYKSIKALKANENKLSENAEEAATEMGSKFIEFAERISKKENTTSDKVVAAINKAFELRYRTEGIVGVFKENGINLSKNDAQILKNLYKESVNLPAEYFEAKAMRSLTFDEVKAAVVPESFAKNHADVVQGLRNYGIDVRTYKDGNDQQRIDILNSFEDLRFQRRIQPTDSMVQYNRKAVNKHKADLEKHYTKSAAVDLNTLNERYDELLKIWDEIGGELNSEFLKQWDNKGQDHAFTVFKAQAGYKYNIELSSMCKKGVPLFEAIDRIVKSEVMSKLKSDTIGKAEKEILYDILKQHHFEIPCAICYVEQARQREGTIINAFLNGNEDGKLGWNEVLSKLEIKMKEMGVDYTFATVSRDISTDNYSAADLSMDEKTQNAFYKALMSLCNDEIDRYNKETKENKLKRKIRPTLEGTTPADVKKSLSGTLPANLTLFKVLFNEPSSRFAIDRDLLYSSMTTLNLAKRHKALYSLFNSQGGTAGYKTKQTPIVYVGDMLKKKWAASTAREAGGIRNQSNSDFQMYTLLDQAQMYMDFTAKGQYLQAYTKVLAELKLFGLSRGKINASLIPAVHVFKDSNGNIDVAKTMENAGLDENGNPIFDDVEGIPHEEAFMLIADENYSKSIGGICIGYSYNHIDKLLDDPRVQLIIGFHDKTNDPDKRYRGARYAHNFNGENEAKGVDDKGKYGTIHIGFNQFVIRAEKMFKAGKNDTFTGTATFNGKQYSPNDIPKLAADLYLDHCEQKDYTPAYERFSTHENYYKLLADFSLYDSKGNYAPHRKVAYEMPTQVPYLDKNGAKKYMDTKAYIKAELEGEMAIRDDLSVALADESADGIIPQFIKKANELYDEVNDVQYQGKKSKYADNNLKTDGVHWGNEIGVMTNVHARKVWKSIAEIQENRYNEYLMTEYGDYYVDADDLLMIVDANYSDPTVRTIFKFDDKYEDSMASAKGWLIDAKGNESEIQDALNLIELVKGEGYVSVYSFENRATYERKDGRGEGEYSSGAVRKIQKQLKSNDSDEQYQQKLPSDRKILADALESVSTTSEKDADIIRRYKAQMDTITKAETRLAEVNAEIKELSFAKGKRDTARLKALHTKKTALTKKVNDFDKRLLRMESTAVLKNVLDREKAKVRAKANEATKQKLNEVRQQERDKAAQREADIKAKATEKLSATKERAAEREAAIREKFREAQEKGRENRAKTELRSKIKKFKEKLENTMLNPTDRTYVPAGLFGAMVDVCELIDTDTDLYKADGSINKAQEKRNLTHERLLALEDEYAKLKSPDGEEIGLGDDYDAVIADYLKKIRTEYSGKSLSDMSVGELDDFYNTLVSIQEVIADSRKLIGMTDAADIYEAADSIADEQRAIRDSRKNGKRNAAQKGKDWIASKSLAPMRAVERMSDYNRDSYLVKLFKKLEAGVRDKKFFKMTAYKDFEAVTTGKNAKNYEAALYDEYGTAMTDKKGNTFHITKMQGMQVMLSYEREMANKKTRHIEADGFSFADLGMIKKGKMSEAISDEYIHEINGKQAMELVERLKESLKNDAWANEYMNAAREFFNDTAKNVINSTMLKLKHRLIAKEKAYIPFEVDKAYLVKEISGEFDIQQTISGYGMLQETQTNAAKPLVITGLNNVLDRHIDQVGSVYGLAIPIRDFNKVWNVRSNETPVNRIIGDTWGKQGKDLITQAIKDLQSKRNNNTDGLLDQIKSNYIEATFYGNFSVISKQIGSMYAARAMIDWRSAPQMLGNLAWTIANYKKLSAEVDQYTASVWMRRQGVSDAELETLLTEKKKGFVGKALSKIPVVNKIPKLIAAMDSAVALSLWTYCKTDVRKSTGLSGEELNVATAEYFDEVVEYTQSMADVLHRPEIQKQGGIIGESLGMFKTDLYQQAGQLQTAFGRYMNTKSKADAKALGKAAYACLSSALWASLMTSLFAILRYKVEPYRDDEDELTAESWLKYQGLALVGDLAGYVLPLAGGEIVGIVRRFTTGQSDDIFSSMALDSINGAIDAVFAIGDIIGKGEMPSADEVDDLLGDVLQMFGIPYNNVSRIVKAIKNHAEDIANDEFLSFNAGKDGGMSKTVKKYTKYIDNGDNKKAGNYLSDTIADKAKERAEKDGYEGDSKYYLKKYEDAAKSDIRADFTKELKPLYLKALEEKDNAATKRIRKIMAATQLYDDIDETFIEWRRAEVSGEFKDRYLDAYERKDYKEMEKVLKEMAATGLWKKPLTAVQTWIRNYNEGA